MDASKQPRPATKTLQAQPWWVVYLPGTAAASAATFLIAGTYVGIKMGLKRGAKLDQQDSGSYARHSAASGPASVAKSAVLPGEPLPGVDARGAFHYKLPNAQGMTAGQLATKAFLYGTLLCLAGSTVLGLGTAWYFDAWTLDAFARRMEEVVPKGKGKLERWLQTPVGTRTMQRSAYIYAIQPIPAMHTPSTPNQVLIASPFIAALRSSRHLQDLCGRSEGDTREHYCSEYPSYPRSWA